MQQRRNGTCSGTFKIGNEILFFESNCKVVQDQLNHPYES